VPLIRAVVVAIFAFIVVFNAAIFSGAAESQHHILILNSYQHGFVWSDEQTDGIVQTFRQIGEDASYVEDMNWQNDPTEDNLRVLHDRYRLKYAGKHIDLIMAVDPAALDFALKYKGELFSDAPVVFSGVNKSIADWLVAGHGDVTGVYAEPDYEGTVRLMAGINPKLRNIYLIYDNSNWGIETGEKMAVAAQRVNTSFAVTALNLLSYDDILKRLAALPADSAVIVGAYSRDSTGQVMDGKHFIKAFSATSSAPLYALYDHYIGYGAMGGMVLSGQRQGELAAGIGQRILAGVPAASIMPNQPTATACIDFHQIERFGVPIQRIPSEATIINRPACYYDWSASGIIIGIVTGVLALGVIAMLLQNIRRRKLAEKELRTSNAELTALFKEMAASQEVLQCQYRELEIIKEALAKSEERYKLHFEGANDGLWDWDILNDEVYFSDRCAEMLGIVDGKIQNMEQYFAANIPPGELEPVLTALHDHLQGKSLFYSCEHRLNTPYGLKWVLARGKVLSNEAGQRIRMAGSITDITERKRNESTINYLAYHDSLTGLANRASLNDRLKRAIISCMEGKDFGALLFIDIDNFKVINDTFGHSYGDRLLVIVAKMFARMDSGNIFVARMGGDEFVILLDTVRSVREAKAYADRTLQLFAEPLKVEDKEFRITISVGLTIFPTDGATAEDLFRNADLAMYRAKDQGKNCYVLFDKKMDDIARNRMIMENSLRNAIANSEFKLLYQPLVCVSTGKIKGFEALIRWHSQEHGWVQPDAFVHIAEETGLIVPIGRWVLKTACGFMGALQQRGYQKLRVSVNISVVELQQRDFVESVLWAIAEAGISPEHIGLEITESLLMESFDYNIEKLAELRRNGINIYLDDFGTGYSSLKYLKNLPIDVVKIDKSFIDDLDNEPIENGLTASIIELAHRLGLQSVAEGVETERQLQELIRFNCDMIQGFLFSKPLTEEKIVELLAESECELAPKIK